MDKEELLKLVQSSTLRSRLNRDLEVKLDDQQYEGLARFHYRYKKIYNRNPITEEYRVALTVINESTIKIRKAKKKGSMKDRIRRIMIKRYGVPESMLKEYDSWFEAGY